MITAVDHLQLAAPPGTEEALRACCAGVLGPTEIPSRPRRLLVRGRERPAPPGHRDDRLRPARKAHPGPRVTGTEAYAARPEVRARP
ncbi:hypothetical protein GCM10010279_35430 [Streptomyces mutabilis]|nr:hypothetical protein GCM10010279_35430 [Streptomyces mutabilis]